MQNGWLKQHKSFFTVLEDGKSKMKVPVGLLPGEALIPNLQMVAKQNFSREIGTANLLEICQKALSWDPHMHEHTYTCKHVRRCTHAL